ncbi:hypothetical protein MSAN_00487300 [Mycena sanguinolenta]|uniref:Uncharacterized protein n=1 Tax=Mycena sanguinolenta TaxID=230812 RepID=A0A8H6Z589_9AGAR|nr:hypothetical protein MSAN_00487300 [Mycena sanguinolenta]
MLLLHAMLFPPHLSPSIRSCDPFCTPASQYFLHRDAAPSVMYIHSAAHHTCSCLVSLWGYLSRYLAAAALNFLGIPPPPPSSSFSLTSFQYSMQ